MGVKTRTLSVKAAITAWENALTETSGGVRYLWDNRVGPDSPCGNDPLPERTVWNALYGIFPVERRYRRVLAMAEYMLPLMCEQPYE